MTGSDRRLFRGSIAPNAFLVSFFIFFCVVWLRDRFSFKWFCSMTGLIDLDKKESLELKAFVSLYLPAVSADPVCS